MQLTEQQITAIKEIDVSGQGGKDAEIATALGHTRASDCYFDAYTENNERVEYKKQSSTQWFDLIKLAEVSDKDKDIPILWFMHDDGSICAIHTCTYAQLREQLGISTIQLRVVRLFSRLCGDLKPQVKIPVKKNIISKFSTVWSK